MYLVHAMYHNWRNTWPNAMQDPNLYQNTFSRAATSWKKKWRKFESIWLLWPMMSCLLSLTKFQRFTLVNLIHCLNSTCWSQFPWYFNSKTLNSINYRTCRGTEWFIRPSSCFRVNTEFTGKEPRFLSSRLPELVYSSQYGRIGYLVLSSRFRQHGLRWIWFRKR